MKIMRITVLVIGAVLLAFGLYYTVFWRHINAGSLMIAFSGIILTLTGIFYGKMSAYLPLRILRTVILSCTAVCFLVAAVISVMMIRCAYSGPSPDSIEGTPVVIVLGCQIRGDRPSKILANRLDAAYEYLAEHGDVTVIVSGGQGPDETVSESYVMANYLISKGLSGDRIILEEKSTNTCTNLEYSGIIIENKGLSKNVLIATDGYHQLRAHTYAEKAGLNPYSLPSESYRDLLPEYWVREILGMLYIRFVER